MFLKTRNISREKIEVLILMRDYIPFPFKFLVTFYEQRYASLKTLLLHQPQQDVKDVDVVFMRLHLRQAIEGLGSFS